MQKNVVIVGYPKSGTTWISRLVAELVECKLQGNWGFDNKYEPIKEGQERVSEYTCYKSHHKFNAIFDASDKGIYKIIYVIRDPRDIAISSLYYFDNTYPKIKNKLLQNSFGLILNKIIQKITHLIKSKNSKKRKMIHMVLSGDKSITEWSELSWKEHFKPYLNNDVLFIKYENMLLNPENECQKILTELNISKSKNHIIESIKNQSFDKKKEEVNTNNKLLRIGKYGYWKTELSDNEKSLFITELKKELSIFKYKIS